MRVLKMLVQVVSDSGYFVSVSVVMCECVSVCAYDANGKDGVRAQKEVVEARKKKRPRRVDQEVKY